MSAGRTPRRRIAAASRIFAGIVFAGIIFAGILGGLMGGMLGAMPVLADAAAKPASASTAAPVARATPSPAGLHVSVYGLRSSAGKVVCTLFASPAGFPADSSKALGQCVAPIRHLAAVCDFDRIAPGRYAIVLFHDENGNGKFDRTWLGMPLEGYGFSNNVRPVFAPPSFDRAAFFYGGGSMWLYIAMRY